ncbi:MULTISPECIES: hypothetical protein [unclassified Arthrobacter]|uniref:hypothetical protein n=1 Tax=unclassified Arthrobacter TaxID=235627 RepID=UPI000B818C42|nr:MULTISPECIES: hypothetical protein [unclassified Arthrobacter]
MGIDAVVAVVVCVALVLGSIWAGTRLVQRGVPAKGATGTLGSVLSMVEPATGAPTRVEAAAALEEMRQRRHQNLSAGPGPAGQELLGGKVVLPNPAGPHGDAKI